MAMKVSNN